MIDFREIANECDGYDAEIERINEKRKGMWASVRDQYPARDVKALKLAIKARRKRKADLDGEEAFDARVYEILTEIERGTDVAREDTRAGAARESFLTRWEKVIKAAPAHDPDTGELTEPVTANPVTVGEGGLSAVGPISVAPSPSPITENPASVSAPVGLTSQPEERGVPQQAGPHDKDAFENSVVPSGDNTGSVVEVGAPFPELPAFLDRKLMEARAS